jgi:hypothetical protein
MALGRPRTSNNAKALYDRERYQRIKVSRVDEDPAVVEAALKQERKKPPQSHRITWLELSSGRSNT